MLTYSRVAGINIEEASDATLVVPNLEPSNPPADARADINADGVANVQDWSILLGNYEESGCQTW